MNDLPFKGGGYTVSIGIRHDGTPAEVFIDSNKRASDADTNARDAAILISLCLQYGVPVDAMQKAISRDEQGEPAGIAGAALDLIAAVSEQREAR